jgi:DNA invertase Pin-like site-specific DNA recombinase
MTFKIVTSDTKRTTFYKHIQLDTSRDTAILIRQSRKGANKDHYESRLLQESLKPFVIEARGEGDDGHIRVYDEGAGVSGTKGIDKRKLLKQLHEDIASGKIGDIVVARADRLFRDKHFDKVSTFTMLAERMRIKVIVPLDDSIIVYDFTKTKDLQAFQQEMQASYGYLENQVGYMNRARDHKKSRGFYGGGCLPLPYVLVKDMPKEEQVPVIYQPWIAPALDLFRKFAEFNYESGRIARYVESKPYIFPFMPTEDLEIYLPVTNMRKTAGGYTFSSPKTLLYYLSNLASGGYAYGGKDEEGNTILIANVFEAAIPMDLLEPAYASINGEYLDGTPFVKNGSTRQFRRNSFETDAILHGLLTSDDGAISVFAQLDDEYPMYACLKGGYLGQKTRAGLGRVLKAWMLPCTTLDKIIVDRLIDLAEYDQDMVERVKMYFKAVSKESESTLTVLDTAIHKTQIALKKLSQAIVLLSMGEAEEEEEKELDPNDPIVKEHKKLAATLRNLQKQREEAAFVAQEDPAQSIENFYYVLSHLRAEFNSQTPQTKKDIIRKLVAEVKVNAISPHLYTLYITWIEPMAARDDVALLWRSDPTKNGTTTTWTQEEDEAVRTLYPDSPQIELMQAIPNKSPAQIKKRASELHVRRQIGLERTFWWTVTYADLEAAAQFTSGEEQQAMLWNEINAMAENTKRRSLMTENTQKGKLTASWFLPVDLISFSRALDVTNSNESGKPEYHRYGRHAHLL